MYEPAVAETAQTKGPDDGGGAEIGDVATDVFGGLAGSDARGEIADGLEVGADEAVDVEKLRHHGLAVGIDTAQRDLLLLVAEFWFHFQLVLGVSSSDFVKQA